MTDAAPPYGAGSHASFPPPGYVGLRDTLCHFRFLQSLNEKANALPGGSIEATLKRVRFVVLWMASVAKVKGLFHLRYRLRLGQRLQRLFKEHMLYRDKALWQLVTQWGAAEDRFRRMSGIASHGQGLEVATHCTCGPTPGPNPGLAAFRFGDNGAGPAPLKSPRRQSLSVLPPVSPTSGPQPLCAFCSGRASPSSAARRLSSCAGDALPQIRAPGSPSARASSLVPGSPGTPNARASSPVPGSPALLRRMTLSLPPGSPHSPLSPVSTTGNAWARRSSQQPTEGIPVIRRRVSCLSCFGVAIVPVWEAPI